MYLELKAPLFLQRLPTVNYQESPYMTLNKRKLQTLTKERAKYEFLLEKKETNINYEISGLQTAIIVIHILIQISNRLIILV